MKTFAGLMSRCMMPRLWMCAAARQSCTRMRSAYSSGITSPVSFAVSMRRCRSPCVAKSITMHSCCVAGSVKYSCTRTMFGWWSALSIFASRSASGGLLTHRLMTSSRESCLRCTRWTVLCMPAPSCRTTKNLSIGFLTLATLTISCVTTTARCTSVIALRKSSREFRFVSEASEPRLDESLNEALAGASGCISWLELPGTDTGGGAGEAIGALLALLSVLLALLLAAAASAIVTLRLRWFAPLALPRHRVYVKLRDQANAT